MSCPATKKLRNLLDEHEIPWESELDDKTIWKAIDPSSGNETRFSAYGCSDNSLIVSIENDYKYTPETAVARTLFIESKLL